MRLCISELSAGEATCRAIFSGVSWTALRFVSGIGPPALGDPSSGDSPPYLRNTDFDLGALSRRTVREGGRRGGDLGSSDDFATFPHGMHFICSHLP